MITYKQGNILDVNEGVIVHGCNLNNGFGSGLAGAIAKKYPYVKQKYHTDHKGKTLGEFNIYSVSENLYIVNAYTQSAYGYDGKAYADLNAIEKSLSEVLQSLSKHDIHTVKIGSGLGGLSWDKQVKPVYEKLGSIYNFTVWEN